MSPLSDTLRSATDSPARSATARASGRRDIKGRICAKTGPAGKESEIGCTRSVAEPTVQLPEFDERRPVFARAAIDPDTALVEQLRRQDAGAAEALVGTYWDRVYRLAIRITGNPSDAEEVVQDTLWAVNRKIDTFRGVAAFSTWLYRITANTAYQKLRGRRSTRDHVSWEDLAPSFDNKVQDPAIGTELRAVLNAAIGELSAIHRTIFILHDVEGLSHSEIAEALQLKAGTIKSRVQRTRLFLRNRLADYGQNPQHRSGNEVSTHVSGFEERRRSSRDPLDGRQGGDTTMGTLGVADDLVAITRASSGIGASTAKVLARTQEVILEIKGA